MNMERLSLREDVRSAYAKVFDILLDMIMTFKLKPFALLSEKAVSEALHVSRSPVREALARLASMGLVDIYAQRGSIVSPLRVLDLQHSQFLRECIEVGILEKACKLSDRSELVKRLHGEIALQETLAAIGDYAGFANSDELFHQNIASAVGYPNIWSDIRNAKLHMSRFRMLTFPVMDNLTTTIAQHKKIATSIEAGNEVSGREAMHENLRKIFPLIPGLIAKFPEYFEVENGDASSRIQRPDLHLLISTQN